MIWKLLLIISLFVIVITLMMRAYLASRVLKRSDQYKVRMNGVAWKSFFKSTTTPLEGNNQVTLYQAAKLWESHQNILWKSQQPKEFRARDRAIRFGSIAPIFILLIGVFSILSARMTVLPVLSMVCMMLAVSCFIGVLSGFKQMSYTMKCFQNAVGLGLFMAEHEINQVKEVVLALIWEQSVPKILRLL